MVVMMSDLRAAPSSNDLYPNFSATYHQFEKPNIENGFCAKTLLCTDRQYLTDIIEDYD